MSDGSVHGIEPRRSYQLLAECEPYLKDGETPVQRIQRERRDTEALLNLLIREKQKSEALTIERDKLLQALGAEFGALLTKGHQP